MAHLPQSVQGGTIEGMKLLSQGKVRDKYELPDNNLLFLTSNRASCFDFVLPTMVPTKGPVLNAINVFMAMEVFADICRQDIKAFGAGIDPYLPRELRGNPDLQKICTVVQKTDPLDCEAIVRNYLLGSSVSKYLRTGMVSGHRLPSGLKEGDALPYSLFTPSNKAEEGHDEHISYREVERRYGGEPERLSLQLMAVARSRLNPLGLEVPDTKFEFGMLNNELILIDERITPDSSRFWDIAEMAKAKAKGKLPAHLDKQHLRNYCLELGINGKLDTNDQEVLQWVASQIFPDEIIETTNQIYRYIAWRIFGKKLELFQHDYMKIDTQPKPVNIEVILGSRSDLPQAESGLRLLENNPFVKEFGVNIISCHRNPNVLRKFLELRTIKNVDVIVAGAGKAAQLPGMTKAFLVAAGNGHIPVIGAAFKGKTPEADKAAILSIKELPGQPVEMDENNEPYFNESGFVRAINAAIENEFLPNIPAVKKAEIGIEF